jgi:hypothetical protein
MTIGSDGGVQTAMALRKQLSLWDVGDCSKWKERRRQGEGKEEEAKGRRISFESIQRGVQQRMFLRSTA